jgi:alkanesulfonate monooxygenase SsuD/methylene tetrahydromethanopterin reductase-like flavin-dependent oxidoreductase (luciferase family)
MTRASFDAQRGSQGALLVGDPDEVAEKIVHHSQALGGISRPIVPTNPIVCAILRMSENPIIPSTIRQME